MKNEMYQATKKIFSCIKDSDTLEKLAVSEKMMDNYFKIYADTVAPKHESGMYNIYQAKFLELTEGVYDETS